MSHVGFTPKSITVYTGEEAGFDCKNNHGRCKSAIFWLDTISKVNFRSLVLMSYTLSGLELRNVQSVWEIFK